MPGGLSDRALLVDDSPQACRVPPGVRRLRPLSGGGVRRQRMSSDSSSTRASFATAARSWPPSRTPEPPCHCGVRSESLAGLVWSHEPARRRPLHAGGRRWPAPRGVEGRFPRCCDSRRVPFRRAYDRVRGHAGARCGQRPPGRLLGPGRVRTGAAPVCAAHHGARRALTGEAPSAQKELPEALHGRGCHPRRPEQVCLGSAVAVVQFFQGLGHRPSGRPQYRPGCLGAHAHGQEVLV